ncbi:MAG: AAA family ATPase [Akkermansiaceae bacterium]|nr:AAA family ATPase [Akkermansiaceae bacterium]MCF7731411.1 AAA family ATPase [Akkermansiaceae bacterium]
MKTTKFLRIIEGTDEGLRVALDSPPVTIGRATDNRVALSPESRVSRHHAELTEDDGTWSVRDLGSMNGTYVNGQRVEWPKVLKPGDKIKIADEVMVFEEGSGDDSNTGSAAPTRARRVPETSANKSGTSTVNLDEGGEEENLAEETAAQLRVLIGRLDGVTEEMGKMIVGQREIIHSLMLALISRGHVLMIGLPGLAKTLMIRTLAEVLDLRFRRIQFTPDLMPTDITGTDVLEVDEATGRKNYRFIRGPVFTNILLADEINRTPPKTQAALLEAMQECHVTAAGETYPLVPPFFVLATQNPLEQEGTYPLPEAQLDRFMFSLRVDYPSEEEEERIAESTTSDRSVELSKRMTGEEILLLQKLVRRLPVSQHVVKYATRIARATRPGDPRAPEAVEKWIHCGAGPRATQYLLLAAKAGAVMRGSLAVNCDDIRVAVPAVLRHRMFTNFAADSEGIEVDDIIAKVLKEVREPGEKDYQTGR